MTTSREGIGTRIARWREIAGLSQQQLALAVSTQLGRTYGQSAVSMVESGKRAVDKRSLLIAFAKALGVAVTDLVGQPYPATAHTDLDLYMVVPAIRASLDPDEPVQPRGLAALGAAVDQAMAARMACDYRTLGNLLPGVIAESRALWQDSADPVAGRLFVQAATTGALALKPAGWIDLAFRLAEAADHTAAVIADPVCQAAAGYTVAQCVLANGNRSRSLALAVAAAGRIESAADAAPADRFAWGTMLHLHAALSAASLHQGGDAEGHLAAARVLAERVEGDPGRMEASPANVATWAVGIALENGEAERAPELARQVDTSALRTKQRRARLFMDTARGLFIAGDPDRAVRAFLAADDAAPGDLRMRPSAVELVGQMVRDAPVRGGSAELRELAVRVGVDPLAPAEPV
jgi:transcriptional regulator with XRE-family HTH domain